jgi:ribonuclease HI
MSDEPSDHEFINLLREDDVLDLLADKLDTEPDRVRKKIDTLALRLEPEDDQNSGKTHRLQVDGGARDNPGPAGGGAVLLDDGSVLREKSEFFGKAVTNNEAEYRALLLGLSIVPDDSEHLTVQMDSQLVVRQLNGEYQVKSEGLRPYFERAQRKLDALESVELEHIPREQNEKADALANEAIDKYLQRESIE